MVSRGGRLRRWPGSHDVVVLLQSAAYYYVLPFLSIFLTVVGGQAIGMRSMCIYELGNRLRGNTPSS